MPKNGNIYNLINRAISLSHPDFQEKNIEFYIKLRFENGYSLNLIFQKINERLKKLFNKKSITDLNKNIAQYRYH